MKYTYELPLLGTQLMRARHEMGAEERERDREAQLRGILKADGEVLEVLVGVEAEEREIAALDEQLVDEVDEFGVEDDGAHGLAEARVLHEREGQLVDAGVGLQAEPVEAEGAQVD